jgi:hypothetical protein
VDHGGSQEIVEHVGGVDGVGEPGAEQVGGMCLGHDQAFVAECPQPEAQFHFPAAPQDEARVKSAGLVEHVPPHGHEAGADDRDRVRIVALAVQPLHVQGGVLPAQAVSHSRLVVQRGDGGADRPGARIGKGRGERFCPAGAGIDVSIAPQHKRPGRELGAEIAR